MAELQEQGCVENVALLRLVFGVATSLAAGVALLLWSGAAIIKGCVSVGRECSGGLPFWIWPVMLFSLILLGVATLLAYKWMVLLQDRWDVAKEKREYESAGGDAAMEQSRQRLGKLKAGIDIAEAEAIAAPPVAAEVAPPPPPPERVDHAALMHAHIAPALALYRPYPPLGVPKLRSRFGGLPELPTGMLWPRTLNAEGYHEADVPLHFMAQIDLSEMPRVHADLPTKGTLLFFARVDEEMLWGDGDPRNDVRVVYDPHSSGVPTRPPEDLPDIAGGHTDYDRAFLLPGEAPTTLYPAWPLRGAVLRSVPDVAAFPSALLPGLENKEAYATLSRTFRVQEISKATNLSPDERAQEPLSLFCTDADGGQILRPVLETGFPWTSRTVSLISRRIILSGAADAEDIRMEQEALTWMERAEEVAPATPLDLDIREIYVNWFNRWLAASRGKPEFRRLTEAVAAALRQLVIESGGNTQLAEQLPQGLYESHTKDHIPFTSYGENMACHHQMFGHVPSTQNPKAFDSTEICLLQLCSDSGSDLMLCDMGEAEFWITPEDLKALNFTKVRGTTCGG